MRSRRRDRIRYLVSHWRWNAVERSYERTSSVYSAGHSLDRARDIAARLAGRVYPTSELLHYYLREKGYAVIEKQKLHRDSKRRRKAHRVIIGKYDAIEPEIVYVTSIGERGY